MLTPSRILITGGTGMLGYAFRSLQTEHDMIFINSKTCDLLDYKATCKTFIDIKPDWVIHLAARVGGVKSNTQFLGDFYRENIMINTHVLEAARKVKVNKLVSVLSTCIYPDKIEYPLRETEIHNGKPHISNYAYAYAKRMLDVQSRSYRDQYGLNYITAVPNNLFGENDNHHLEDCHVIPAIIHKMFNSIKTKRDVVLWGDGSPLREFTYSQDVARILLYLLENYNDRDPINIGNTIEMSIKEIAETIKRNLGFKGNIIWDTSKPMGQFRKPSSNKKLLNLAWRTDQYTDFHLALEKSCNWFVKNYPNIRGIK